MTTLTINNIHEFINKPISIYCKQYEGNADVYGQAVITEFSKDECNPIKVGNATGEGHFLEYALINEDGTICIGDTDRPVEVELCANGLALREVIENAIKRIFNPANGYTELPFEVYCTSAGVELRMIDNVLNEHYISIINSIAQRLNVSWYIDFFNKVIRIN